MGTYFKPLRRKIGAVTLVIACVFMAGWVDSFDASRRIDLPNWGNTTNEILLSEGEITFCNIAPYPTKQSDESWARGLFGFWVAQWYAKSGRRLATCSIPYWSIVIPLTLLSAFLLLSKPRLPKKSVPEARDDIPARNPHQQGAGRESD